MKASAFYGAKVWRLELAAARLLPPALYARWCQRFAVFYYHTNWWRRNVVTNNLLPVLGGDRAAAKREARELFRQFARKLVDLWQFENGCAIDGWIREWTGWDHFLAAHARKKGLLVLTPHLGNWELGGPLLVQRGYPLHVITQAEPETELTRMRQAARARWGIETLVIGTNPFAYLEVVQKLKQGATVAMLVDRPARSGAIKIDWFGRPFQASLAAVELARASGAALLPIYIPRKDSGYAVCALPEIPYDPDALERREARLELARQILRAFEPVIRQYVNQWYHFIPVWKA